MHSQMTFSSAKGKATAQWGITQDREGAGPNLGIYRGLLGEGDF